MVSANIPVVKRAKIGSLIHFYEKNGFVPAEIQPEQDKEKRIFENNITVQFNYCTLAENQFLFWSG